MEMTPILRIALYMLVFTLALPGLLSISMTFRQVEPAAQVEDAGLADILNRPISQLILGN